MLKDLTSKIITLDYKKVISVEYLAKNWRNPTWKMNISLDFIGAPYESCFFMLHYIQKICYKMMRKHENFGCSLSMQNSMEGQGGSPQVEQRYTRK